MRSATALELLGVWERGLEAEPVRRGLELLALAEPDASADALADLSIGARDARLLALREAIFGPDVTGIAACPGCGETLETSFRTSDLRADAPEDAPPGLALQMPGYDVRLRLLTSRDLAAAQHADPDERRRILLDRCVVSAAHDGAPASADQLPAEIVDAAARRLAEADRQADTQLAMSCPACGHQWRAPFDILSFLWTELEAWAGRMLREVHVLASVYGWSEREILSLGPIRRRHYLGMVGAWPIS